MKSHTGSLERNVPDRRGFVNIGRGRGRVMIQVIGE